MSEILQDTSDCRCFSEEKDGERLILSAAALPAEGVPAEVLIAPWGRVLSANGEFLVDEDSAAEVLAAFRKHGTDLPIDYEHQSLGGAYASPSGQAPAAGWIRELRVVRPGDLEGAGQASARLKKAGGSNEVQPAELEGAGQGGGGGPEAGETTLLAGLWGRVEWTEAARDKLAAKEYRYLSPVVLVRRSDRRVVALHSAALTNKPAIAGMRPIVNREACDGTAAAEEPAMSAAVEALRMRLGLEADAGIEMVLASAERRLAEMAHEAAEQAAEGRVAAAMSAGKLTPGMRAWALALAAKDCEAFEAWAAAAPVVVALGRTQAPASGADGDGVVALAAAERRVTESARAAFRAEPALAALTSEAAWVADALREAGLSRG